MIGPHDLPPRPAAFLTKEQMDRRRADLQRRARNEALVMTVVVMAILFGLITLVAVMAR